MFNSVCTYKLTRNASRQEDKKKKEYNPTKKKKPSSDFVYPQLKSQRPTEGAGTLQIQLQVFKADNKSFVKFEFLATKLFKNLFTYKTTSL